MLARTVAPPTRHFRSQTSNTTFALETILTAPHPPNAKHHNSAGTRDEIYSRVHLQPISEMPSAGPLAYFVTSYWPALDCVAFTSHSTPQLSRSPSRTMTDFHSNYSG